MTHFRHQKLALGSHSHPLVRALFKEMNRQKTLLRDVGKESGVAWNTISEWRYRSNPTLTAFVAVANALGLDVVLQPMAEGYPRSPQQNASRALKSNLSTLESRT